MNAQPQPQLLGGLPLVKAERFRALGEDYWSKLRKRGVWPHGGSDSMDDLQRTLYAKAQEGDGTAFVLNSMCTPRYWRTPCMASLIPYHSDLLPHFLRLAKAKEGMEGLESFEISRVSLPPNFFRKKLVPILTNSNTSLLRLDLVRCLRSCDIRSIGDFLVDNASLVTLDISCNNLAHKKFPVDDVQFLALSIWNHPALSFLNASSCGIGKKTEVLSAMLDGSTNLKSLIIDNNRIDTEEAFGIVANFLTSNTSLTVFSMKGNAFGAVASTTTTKARSTALRKALKKSKIRELNLGGCGLRLPAFLSGSGAANLLTLHLRGNGIRTEGARMVASYIETNPPLVELNVSNNKLCFAAKDFSSALAQNTNLQILDMGCCNLSDKAVPALVDLLKNNRTLLSLDLTSNWNMKVETGRKVIVKQALCDPTSLATIAESNHVCKVTIVNSTRKDSTYEKEMRRINSLDTEGQKIRYKVVIAMTAMNEDLFCLRDFDNIPLECMHLLLHLLQQELGFNGFGEGIVDKTNKKRGKGGDPALNRLYEVVHGWNIPWLFVRGPGKLTKKRIKRKRTEEEDDEDWQPSSRSRAKDALPALAAASSLRSRSRAA